MRFRIGDRAAAIAEAAPFIESRGYDPRWLARVGQTCVVISDVPYPYPINPAHVYDYVVRFEDGQTFRARHVDLRPLYDGNVKSSWDVGVWKPAELRDKQPKPVSA